MLFFKHNLKKCLQNRGIWAAEYNKIFNKGVFLILRYTKFPLPWYFSRLQEYLFMKGTASAFINPSPKWVTIGDCEPKPSIVSPIWGHGLITMNFIIIDITSVGRYFE